MCRDSGAPSQCGRALCDFCVWCLRRLRAQLEALTQISLSVASLIMVALKGVGCDVEAVEKAVLRGGPHKARLMLYSRDRALGVKEDGADDPVWLADHADYSYVPTLPWPCVQDWRDVYARSSCLRVFASALVHSCVLGAGEGFGGPTHWESLRHVHLATTQHRAPS